MDQQLRRFLIAMLAGAGIMVIGQIGAGSPEGQVEVAIAWFTAAAAIVAVSLALYEWRQARRPPQQDQAERIQVR